MKTGPHFATGESTHGIGFCSFSLNLDPTGSCINRLVKTFIPDIGGSFIGGKGWDWAKQASMPIWLLNDWVNKSYMRLRVRLR